MKDIKLWKIFVSLGVPGLALGIFYMLFDRFSWVFPTVPEEWTGPIIVLFMILSSAIVFSALVIFKPSKSNSSAGQIKDPFKSNNNTIYYSDFSVKWTDDGPIIKDENAQIHPPESNALITKYSEYIHIMSAEKGYGGDMKDFILGPAGVVATFEACKDIYGAVPTEEELKAANTELSKKSNLFYKFVIKIVEEGSEDIMNF